jgi:4-hydroxybenzoyl-CoA thioesterase
VTEPTEAGPFRREVLIRFAHCDMAGIVFYPRYLEIFNDLVEDWFRLGLSFGFSEMHRAQRMGIPTVHLEVDFVAPSGVGDVLEALLTVRETRRTSMTLRIDLNGPEGAPRVRGKVVLVFLDLESRKPIVIPDFLRPRIERFVPAEAAP